MFARRLSTASSSFCRAFWCSEAAYIKSCFSSSSVSGTVPQPLESFLRTGRVERWIRIGKEHLHKLEPGVDARLPLLVDRVGHGCNR